MGIPKFFRFISERWPLISQLIDNTQIPEFDNLYLDMNSILHTCTHSNDDTLTRLSEEQMFSAIFAYIDHLFNTIKPQKTFYMAIDGVAPRAKMNQQRARRFRTALEAEKNLEKAIKQGLEIPKEEPFDSNAITPGTEFMANLTKALKFYIHQKTSTDAKWQNIRIVLSGHECPGEGEHKIMEYIRTMKSQSDYEPNLRHCIYGLDADLIMLGLVSHEPHFALLREEVFFGRRPANSQSSDLTKQNFYLLHLSLVREYLELEFDELKDQVSFDYDFERVLDDFILIMYVIGNDFLPNLPDLHINKGAFPLLVATFKQAMKCTDGYLNENGTINLPRLGVWLQILSQFERENFEKVDVDVEWFNKQLDNISLQGDKKRSRQGKVIILKQHKKLVNLIKPWALNPEDNQLDIPLELVASPESLDFARQFAIELGVLIVRTRDGVFAQIDPEAGDYDPVEARKVLKKYQAATTVDEESLEESQSVYDAKFINWKDKYYKEKLGFSLSDTDKMKEFTENYVEGLQWVLYYYYKGCPSWPWYYKYHYAPRISDISLGLDAKISFNEGSPFLPFQQLMAVLPARSRALIPHGYRALMTDEKSPILDLYPHEVEVDKNGKTADWEAVVKLEFVDEKRLIRAMEPHFSALTDEEKQRNSFGKELVFRFNPQASNVYSSPNMSSFSSIIEDHCVEQPLVLPVAEKVVAGLCDGVVTGVNAPAGFPTLKTIPFSAELKRQGVLVFNMPSRAQSMILNLENCFQGLTPEQFANEYCNKVVYTRWPYLREAKVTAVFDELFKYQGKKSQTPLEHFEREAFFKTRNAMLSTLLKSKGVCLGAPEDSQENPVTAIVEVRPVTGLIKNKKGAYIKTFSDQVETYPIHLVVDSVVNVDPRYEEKPPVPLEQEFPVDCTVVFLGSFAYGSPARVIGHHDGKLKVTISKTANAEPTVGSEKAELERKTIKYFKSYEAARILRMHSLLLSKITSSFMVECDGKRVNVGLDLKFESKKLKVLGYTRRTEKGWEYSVFAINLLQEYVSKFPLLFKALGDLKSSSIPQARDLSMSSEQIAQVVSFVKEKRAQFVTVSLESEALTKIGMQQVEQSAQQYVPVPQPPKAIQGIPKTAVLDANNSFQLLARQFFRLGDRVVYVLDSGRVPLFSKGTVVGIRALGTKVSLQVVFDSVLMTGNTFDGRLQTQRGLSIDSSALLNLTNKQFLFHSQKNPREQKNGQSKGKAKDEKPRKAKTAVEHQEKASTNEENKAKEDGAKELLSLIKKSPAESGDSNPRGGFRGRGRGRGRGKAE